MTPTRFISRLPGWILAIGPTTWPADLPDVVPREPNAEIAAQLATWLRRRLSRQDQDSTKRSQLTEQERECYERKQVEYDADAAAYMNRMGFSVRYVRRIRTVGNGEDCALQFSENGRFLDVRIRPCFCGLRSQVPCSETR